MEPVLLGVLWGAVFGAVFCLATLVMGRINVEMLLNDYPADVKAKYGPMSPSARKQGSRAGIVLLAVLLAVLAAGVFHLQSRVGLRWGSTYLFLLIVLQVWNLIDLIILDWFLLMTLRPSYMILPGTQGMPGYRDYRFHFKKFLNGIALTAVLAGILTVIVMALSAIF